ncbi:MAG: lipoyl synthase [Candidatus Thermoplasmatota archaeon]
MSRRHPDWLKVKIGGGENFVEMKNLLRRAKLHTICEEAKCPNIAECFGSGTAVFLLLGDICTRSCGYCNVKHGLPRPVNHDEPYDVAESVRTLGLRYVVITSVTRDDLPDGGAKVFSDTIKEIKRLNNKCRVEALIPDFKGDVSALRTIIDSEPDVINHNIEVVKELFPTIRPQGDYDRSIKLLEHIKRINPLIKTKSGLMIGLGESLDQIIRTFNDLRMADVDILTIGQYLQPSKQNVSVKKYYTPLEFQDIKKTAERIGFRHVESGPLVRSSYHAEKLFAHR